MHFHVFPACHHGLDTVQRLWSRNRCQVNVTDDEGCEQPGQQSVGWGKDGQSAKESGDGRNFLDSPHHDAGDALQGEQDGE